MSLFLLSLTVLIPVPFCWLRREKYDISLSQMLIIYVVVSAVGAVGACIGSFVAGGPITSVRLYGLIILDCGALFALSRLMRIDIGRLGDFISVPIMVVCFSSKINCLLTGCCRGILLFETAAGTPVRFPSAIFEMLLWATLAALLLLAEKRGTAKNTLWAVAVIWFGILRFFVSLLREFPERLTAVLPGVSGGMLWSAVAFLLGVVYLYYFLKRGLGRKPKLSELLRASVGKAPTIE